eukprot:scaffold416_cov329-Pavlova_lutheri.AAC.19
MAEERGNWGDQDPSPPAPHLGWQALSTIVFRWGTILYSLFRTLGVRLQTRRSCMLSGKRAGGRPVCDRFLALLGIVKARSRLVCFGQLLCLFRSKSFAFRDQSIDDLHNVLSVVFSQWVAFADQPDLTRARVVPFAH